MSEYRNEKIANHIRELAATFIEREGGNTSIITRAADLAAKPDEPG